jgi:hypothetical protein
MSLVMASGGRAVEGKIAFSDVDEASGDAKEWV